MTATTVLRVVRGPDTGIATTVEHGIVVGREGDLTMSDPRVSRRHLDVRIADGGVIVRDLGSAAGSASRGRPIGEPTFVPAGATIELGGSVLRVLQLAAVAPTTDAPFTSAGRPLRVVDELTVGREVNRSALVIDHPTVSRHHATLGVTPNGCSVTDADSANGTFVNGTRVLGRHALQPGDVVTFGRAPTTVVVNAAPQAEALRIYLATEGQLRRYAVAVSTPPQATVATVLAACRTYVGVDDEDDHHLYRSGPGLILPADASWSACGIRDGEEIVLAVGDVPAGAHGVPVEPTPPRSPVTQLPRQVHLPVTHTVHPPDQPESTRLRGRGVLWQVLAGATALVAGIVISVLRPSFAVFGLLMAGAGGTSMVVTIVGEHARRKRSFAEFAARVAALDTELNAVVARQRGALREVSPDDVTLRSILTERRPRLWERRADDPDALMLRVGSGNVRALVTVEERFISLSGRHVGSEVDDVVRAHDRLDDVPICITGGSGRVAALTGPAEVTEALLARMLLEAAILNPPDQLRIVVLADTAAWAWARWLPHTANAAACWVARRVDEANALAQRLIEEQADVEAAAPGRPTNHRTLVIVAGAATTAPNVTELLRRGLPAGSQIVAAAADAHRLPGGVSTLLECSADGSATVVGEQRFPAIGSFRVVGMPLALAERMAAEFASIDAGSGRRANASSGLIELATGATLTTLDVAASWRRDRPGIAAPIGTADDGSPMVLDFRRDGPHGMIAGTTGSGKSELLQTLLIGLALTHRPEHLNLFLIDFKGGATFSPLAALPHVVGLVTDLESNGDLATRAFTSLDAEIERRKRILDAADVPNIVEYEVLDEAATEPLANLLVVIDEFALLMKNQPELRERLDTVATQGRSLGVHLLLATQSPTGVITNAIRTNTNLWLCLRVVADAESSELLGKRDAARIATDRPGRGFLRKGASDVISGFQAARIARDVDDGAGPTVEIVPFVDDAPTVARQGEPMRAGGRRTTELSVACGLIVAAASSAAIPAQRPLWSPPLPDDLDPATLPPLARADGRLVGSWGLVDLPHLQRQEPALVDLTASGNALVVGQLGSGVSTALRQLVFDLTAMFSPAELHVAAIDAGAGSLGELGRLPHCAAVIGAGDNERISRVIERLVRQLDDRAADMAASGVNSFAAWRRSRPAPPPWHLLVIDDFAALRQWLDNDTSPTADRFAALLRGGPAAGIHVVIGAAQSTDIRITQLNLLGHRIVLRAADALEFQLIDVRLRLEQTTRWPAGRGLVAGGFALQVARPRPPAADDRARTWSGVDPASLPRPVRRLPTEVELADLGGSSPRNGEVALGLGGADCDPVVIDFERTNNVLLVIGPSQSGRSTTLTSILTSVLAAGGGVRARIVAPRRSPLRDLDGHPDVDVVAETPERIAAALDGLDDYAGPPLLVLVDDAEALTMEGSDRFERALRRAPDSGVRFVVAARTTDLQGIYDPWSRYVQTVRLNLALQPGAAESMLLSFRVPPGVAFPAGRGLLLDRGVGQVVQVHRTAPKAFSVSSEPTVTVNPSTTADNPAAPEPHKENQEHG